MGHDSRNDEVPQFTDHCFTGDYPTRLRYTPHPSHFSLEETLEAIERVKPKRAILTHMHTDLDYDTLVRELPDGVEPAYDGMILKALNS